MFTKILVPLDGSTLAERALTPALAIAKKFKGELLLLRVTTPEEAAAALPPMAGYVFESSRSGPRAGEAEAEAYLRGLKTCQLESSVPVYIEVLRGTPPEMIAAAANEQHVDLIVMSTHGRSGFDRLIYGSVAEAVMRGTHVPVMMVPSRT